MYLTADFLQNILGIDDITELNMDCAHRVGAITEEKTQTMLVHFYSREDVSRNLYKRRMLAGSQFVIFEDTTLLNRLLINNLKDHIDVHSAWCSNGQVWARRHDSDKKIKFGILDNIDDKLRNPQ